MKAMCRLDDNGTIIEEMFEYRTHSIYGEEGRLKSPETEKDLSE